MLSHDPYYHAITRKLIVAFGQLFTDIKINRFNNQGLIEQTIAVPVSYGNKEKWYQRLKEEPNIEQRVLITLPRIGFEITGFQYDPSRKLNRFTQYRNCSPDSNGDYFASFTPVPYNVMINLYVLTKTSDDMLNIIEQILPFFTPHYDLTINAVPAQNIIKEVPITFLGTVQLNDSYEGVMSERRELISTLSFSAKVEFIGPMKDVSSQIIKKVITNVDAGGDVGRGVKVEAVGVPDNYTTIEDFFDVPLPLVPDHDFSV